MRRILIVFIVACGSQQAPLPAPAPVHVDAGVDAGLAPGMITDDDCFARGGHIDTEQTYAHLRRARTGPIAPFRICRIPNPADGKTCSGDNDCNGARCMCQGALARPDPDNDPALRKLDGTAGTGVCSEQALPDGSWFCMVEDGKIHLNGIIID